MSNIRKTSLFGTLVVLLLAPSLVASQSTEISARGSTLRIGGRIHAQFAHSSVEGARTANFFIRRARIVFDVKINDLVSGKLEHDFVAGLRDAYFRFNKDQRDRVGDSAGPVLLGSSPAGTFPARFMAVVRWACAQAEGA